MSSRDVWHPTIRRGKSGGWFDKSPRCSAATSRMLCAGHWYAFIEYRLFLFDGSFGLCFVVGHHTSSSEVP